MFRRSRSVRPRHDAGLSRRIMLQRLAGIATFAAGIRSASADDRPLHALDGRRRSRRLGGYRSYQASRTVHMPKATIPMLSPGTAEATRRAVEVYDGIVARGGWPEVSKVLELRLGTDSFERGRIACAADDFRRSRSQCERGRERHLCIPISEEAVRRFQTRHGLTVDGVVHEATFDAMTFRR